MRKSLKNLLNDDLESKNGLNSYDLSGVTKKDLTRYLHRLIIFGDKQFSQENIEKHVQKIKFLIEFLIENGAEVNETTGFHGVTPLIDAVLHFVPCVPILLEYGADPSKAQLDDRLPCYNPTPLHIACNYGYDKVVQQLLKYGADVNARFHNEEYQPLHEASKNLFFGFKCVKLLLEHGADPLSYTKSGKNALYGFINFDTAVILHKAVFTALKSKDFFLATMDKFSSEFGLNEQDARKVYDFSITIITIDFRYFNCQFTDEELCHLFSKIAKSSYKFLDNEAYGLTFLNCKDFTQITDSEFHNKFRGKDDRISIPEKEVKKEEPNEEDEITLPAKKKFKKDETTE
jgi:hypothetical protein